MTKPAKSTNKEKNAKPRGRSLMVDRQTQGLPINPNMTVSHMPMTLARKSKFLDYIAANGSVEQSARQTDGFDSVRSYRQLIATDSLFKNQYDDALASFAGRVNEALIHEAVEGVESYVVSAGEMVTGPDKKPLKIKKREPKLLAMLARSLNAKLRDSKTVVSVNGGQVDDPANPGVYIRVSDLALLSLGDREQFSRIVRMIAANTAKEFELPDLKLIGRDIVDAEFSEVIPNESPMNPTIESESEYDANDL